MVFEDPTGRRWKLARLLALAAGIVCLLVIGDVVASLLMAPALPRLAAMTHLPENDAVIENISDPTTEAARMAPRRTARSAPLMERPFVRTAFLVQDDPASVSDLRQSLSRLDAVFPDWYAVQDEQGALKVRINSDVLKVLRDSGVKVLPRLSNTDADGAWHGDMLGDLLKDSQAADDLADAIAARLKPDHADGINVDFEEVPPEVRDAYLDWLDNLAEALHQQHMLLTVDVPVGEEEAFDYEQIGRIADAVVVMGYDEHYPGGAAGAVASQPWFDDALDDLAERIPQRKLIAALGAYGYDWNLDRKGEARSLSFAEVMDLAGSVNAAVATDKQAVNSTFSYRDREGARHQVWFLDAVSGWNEYLSARRHKFAGVSLWRLGMEESALWDFFAAEAPDGFNPENLRSVRLPAVSFRGEGEMLEVRRAGGEGARSLSFDGRAIDFASYQRLPSLYQVQRRGHRAKKIALTFDDGPDPDWTPRVLEVLRGNAVPATFFVVGDQVRKFPDLVKQELGQGHLVGNHTFSHPNPAALSDGRLKLELSATQRMIESTTGRQTLLFRTPYDTDSTPTITEQLRPLYIASQLGYVCAGGDIDSEDYNCPGVDRIVRNVIARLAESGSSVIVMHDAGGDRAQTVQALGQIIPLLRKQGYQFVTVADLLGTTPDELMPLMSSREQAIVAPDRVMSWLTRVGWWILMRLFLVTTAFALGRSLLLAALVYFRSRRKISPSHGEFFPPVLVLIPAFNEEKVIARTLEAVLRSDYPNFRVVVVDDGSTDDTAAIVADLARADPRIGLLSKQNGGKFSALNRGLREAWEEYIVTIDADTIVAPDTVRRLVARFADAGVDAVCGNVLVGNANHALTHFQDVEYVTSQGYDRRAFDAVNCIPVVPGATGAWRRRTVLKAGGYSADTLTEDADLTLTLLANGSKIVYEPEARSITEAPAVTACLFKQRFRWGYGTLQCLWKHRGRFARGPMGWIALPNLLLFQIVFPTLAPLSLLVVLISLLRGAWLLPVIWLAVFVAVDLAGAAVAFALERRRLRGLWVVLLQRLYYRPFMYVVTLHALLAALRGRRHAWNKLDRHGSVQIDRTILHPLGWDLPEQAAAYPAA